MVSAEITLDNLPRDENSWYHVKLPVDGSPPVAAGWAVALHVRAHEAATMPLTWGWDTRHDVEDGRRVHLQQDSFRSNLRAFDLLQINGSAAH